MTPTALYSSKQSGFDESFHLPALAKHARTVDFSGYRQLISRKVVVGCYPTTMNFTKRKPVKPN
jgi:hypothetical protein